MTDDEIFMEEALVEARKGLAEGEVPIGAVAVKDGQVVARGHNRRNAPSDITAHAEMMCLRDMSSRNLNFNLSNVTIYSTLEPCPMCTGAMIHYKIARVVFGEYDIIAGACGSKFRFSERAGLLADSNVLRHQCRHILLEYFESQLGHKSIRWMDIELPEA